MIINVKYIVKIIIVLVTIINVFKEIVTIEEIAQIINLLTYCMVKVSNKLL